MKLDEKQARKILGGWLRQCSGGTVPREVTMTPALEQVADRATAQKIWNDLLATWPGKKET